MEPLTLSQLIETLPKEESLLEGDSSKYQQTIGLLLESGFLKMSAGKLTLGEAERS